ncbi:MAG: bifunctional phosphopantothenoylcysteine decarboxylase/phosphopantothenate--cysteine ligase CoaBC [Pseudomonadota bacterium]
MELTLQGRRIILGVSGGIAAYKSPDLVRRLKERGASVRVVMTASAQEFVTPLTFQAVSGEPVGLDLLDPAAEAAMGHIELARWADLILIAPATANTLARLAAGLADDLLTTLVLASAAPLALAPAMNRQMWDHAATRENLTRLEARGARMLGPGSGSQACGETGTGRMLEPDQLAEAAVHTLLAPESRWVGRRVLISAGPTLEDLDPVRYLGNRSSGRMGFALAAAAAAQGAQVHLVAGPVQLTTPAGVTRHDVRSARDMLEAVLAQLEAGCDLYIGAAAVADFRAAQTADRKIKKSADSALALELEQNPDILASVASHPQRPFTVGFAAETHDLETHAKGKLERKKVDLIAANPVGGEACGFDGERNGLTVFGAGAPVVLPQQSKQQLAHQLLDLIAAQKEWS